MPGMRSYQEFADELLTVVGPHLSPAQERSVQRYLEVGGEASIVLDLISKAATARIPLPARLYNEILARIDEGIGFSPKIATVLRSNYRDELVVDTAA